MANQEMMDKIKGGKGFISALDQSGGSSPGALARYGVAEDSYSGDDEMFAAIHDMRVRIMTSPVYGGDRVLGAILFEKTMDGDADGKPVPEYLWSKGVVPFLKCDKGLEDEANGVQLMKPMPGLDDLLQKGVSKGVFGTKMRSVIQLANAQGIADIVKQQFDIGMQILGHGLCPMLEPEVNIKSAERAEADQILHDELLKGLDALPADKQVMLKLSIPVQSNLYADLVNHPRTVRVVALSGGYSTNEACGELGKNNGMIASFSRALLEGLQYGQSEDEFNAALGSAIQQIYDASVS